ncbi:unnamed protein product [Fraxinus pennsylvanica]|uniref:Uncharacterized protein n=1 Tax=Fraxinus pennsylvanica TaxID=56036 RepID=A0AAD1ZWX0_9LAMI|nr:unnamed protein product [Fraxinus pennsylvanica]
MPIYPLPTTETSIETLFPKCVSALLLIVGNLVQPRPIISVDSNVETIGRSIHGSSENHTSSELVTEKSLTPVAVDKESVPVFDNILGKMTGSAVDNKPFFLKIPRHCNQPLNWR